MFVKYLGHSAFYLKGKDFSVVTDPFADIGYDVERVECDYALSSHGHFDHNNFSGVNAKYNVRESFGPFKAIPCWHDEVCGKKRGENNAFWFEMDGLKILHLGDIGEPFSPEIIAKLSLGVDILFIPVGGTYTIDAADALRYAEGIDARVTVAMHYKTSRSKIDIASPERFVEITGAGRVENQFEITADNISSFPKFVVVDFD